jgi:YgjP-like, metallopeptidase domain
VVTSLGSESDRRGRRARAGQKASECLEYIVVHEMVHLLERNHTERYYRLLNRFMPKWQLFREELNRAPLADENWSHNGGGQAR